MNFFIQVIASTIGLIVGYFLYISTEAALYICKARIKGFRYRLPTYRTFKVVFHMIKMRPFNELPPFEECVFFEEFSGNKRANDGCKNGYKKVCHKFKISDKQERVNDFYERGE